MRPEWDILPPILLSVVRRFDGRFEKEDIQLLLDKEFGEDNLYRCLVVAQFPIFEADPYRRDYNYKVLTGLIQVIWNDDGDKSRVYYYMTEDSEPYTAKVKLLKGSDVELYHWFQERCEQINQFNTLQQLLSQPCPYVE